MNYERIANLLASGIPAATVATVVGLSLARISQISKDPEFLSIYNTKIAEAKGKDAEEESLEVKYQAAEGALINQILELAPSAEMRDVVGALKVVAERRIKVKELRNPIPLPNQAPIHNTYVQLNLPSHALPTITFSNTREVTSIEDRTLAPLSSKGVINLFNGMDRKAEVIEDRTAGINETKSKGEEYEPDGIITSTETSTQEVVSIS